MTLAFSHSSARLLATARVSRWYGLSVPRVWWNRDALSTQATVPTDFGAPWARACRLTEER